MICTLLFIFGKFPGVERMEMLYSFEIDSPIANRCTAYIESEKTLYLIQQRYNSFYKYTWWGPIDREIADAIFHSDRFREYFEDHTSEMVEVRKVIWALRLPKIPKQIWETTHI